MRLMGNGIRQAGKRISVFFVHICIIHTRSMGEPRNSNFRGKFIRGQSTAAVYRFDHKLKVIRLGGRWSSIEKRQKKLRDD